MELIESIRVSASQGVTAHYHVAHVVKQLFGDVWVYRNPVGWRARTPTGFLMGADAVLYIKRKLSEDVAYAYADFAENQNEEQQTVLENAQHIAHRLKNNTYKNEIMDEAASLFFEY